MRTFKNVTETRSKTMSHIRGKDTSIEVALRKALREKGYHYRKNYKALPGSPDICLTKYKLAIFCDSEFFHGKDWEVLKPKVEKGNNGEYWVRKIQDNIERDSEIDKRLLFMGWTVIHFWGKDILKKTDECVRTIEEVIFDIRLGEADGEA
ncbi:very short patch repair endonuclease [Acetatifactor aquisgranensis]|uniref:very short patch repair endonuclease n=1 Tax=Acetatifactor aquisgranensis TaxID=2941233 RepID=UPI00203D544A|nr:very short patch repair endonuclease [Acetatifactor aquisgranensis]MCI8542829.1 very short patch repair endonuclease [Lachnospiraceae bacterium]